jgi:hypothetical protein
MWSCVYEPDCLPKPKFWQFFYPVWWASDDERNMNWSWMQWFKRNFFANFNAKVIGVTCYPRWWISTMDGQNFPETGWGFAICQAKWCLPRYYVCRRGLAPDPKIMHVKVGKLSIPFLGFVMTDMEIAVGWKSHGGFGIDYRHAHAPNAPDQPNN